jgi:hypothetical protein
VQYRWFVDGEDALRKVAIENADLNDGATFGEGVEKKVSAGCASCPFGEQAFDPAAAG